MTTQQQSSWRLVFVGAGIAAIAFWSGRSSSPVPHQTPASSPVSTQPATAPPIIPASAAVPADASTAPTSVQVWVNTKTGIYHFPGTRWYGNTSQGEYMSEKEAQTRGYRASANGQ